MGGCAASSPWSSRNTQAIWRHEVSSAPGHIPVTLMTSRVLWVAGLVSYEYLVYPMDASAAALRQDHGGNGEDEDAAHLVIRTGDADLVAKLLAAAGPQHGIQVLGPMLQHSSSHYLRHNASRISDLQLRHDTQTDHETTYLVEKTRLIGRPPVWHSPCLDNQAVATGGTVVITGSGEAFKDVEPALDFLQRVRPRYIIHHMTRPLASGPLWDLIRNGPMTRDGVPDPEFLAVIIDADDLRAEGIALSQSLSWETTAEDFVRNLGSNGRLDTLVTCPNLIVRFGSEGVIYHRGRDAGDPKLYFDPRRVESRRAMKCAASMVSQSTGMRRHLD